MLQPSEAFTAYILLGKVLASKSELTSSVRPTAFCSTARAKLHHRARGEGVSRAGFLYCTTVLMSCGRLDTDSKVSPLQQHARVHTSKGHDAASADSSSQQLVGSECRQSADIHRYLSGLQSSNTAASLDAAMHKIGTKISSPRLIAQFTSIAALHIRILPPSCRIQHRCHTWPLSAGEAHGRQSSGTP